MRIQHLVEAGAVRLPKCSSCIDSTNIPVPHDVLTAALLAGPFDDYEALSTEIGEIITVGYDRTAGDERGTQNIFPAGTVDVNPNNCIRVAPKWGPPASFPISGIDRKSWFKVIRLIAKRAGSSHVKLGCADFKISHSDWNDVVGELINAPTFRHPRVGAVNYPYFIKDGRTYCAIIHIDRLERDYQSIYATVKDQLSKKSADNVDSLTIILDKLKKISDRIPMQVSKRKGGQVQVMIKSMGSSLFIRKNSANDEDVNWYASFSKWPDDRTYNLGPHAEHLQDFLLKIQTAFGERYMH